MFHFPQQHIGLCDNEVSLERSIQYVGRAIKGCLAVYFPFDKVAELIVYNTAHCFLFFYLFAGLNSKLANT